MWNFSKFRNYSLFLNDFILSYFSKHGNVVEEKQGNGLIKGRNYSI